ADCLNQMEPRAIRTVLWLHSQKAAGHQAFELIQKTPIGIGIARFLDIIAAYVANRGECATRVEDTKSCKQRAFVVLEQIVTPGDCLVKCAVAEWSIGPAATRQWQDRGQSGEHRLRIEHA